MFKLESEVLKREFKIANSTFYASQIQNKISDMGFVPDGNGCEFVVFFTDGSEVSSKGLPVVESREENERLYFTFEESLGCTVELEYWVHSDKKTLCKQLIISQSDDKIIDRIFLDNIGIINSKTHFGIDPKTHKEGKAYLLSLGQPFYIDSLFFACDNPAVDSKIIHGAGQMRYYLGKNVGKNFHCPVTYIGGAKDNTIIEVKKAFTDFLDSISLKSEPRFQYKNEIYFLVMGKKTTSEYIANDFAATAACLNAPDMIELSDLVIGNEPWANKKGKFWEFNKNFPDRLDKIKAAAGNTGLGIEINPSGVRVIGGTKKLAKKIQSAGLGFINNDEICTSSTVYCNALGDFIAGLVRDYDLSFVSLGDFGSALCEEESHDHLVGGKNNMYCVTASWENRISLIKKIREAKENIYIHLSSPDNASPFWLGFVNCVSLTALSEKEEATNYEEQPDGEARITLDDAIIYDAIAENAMQIPLERTSFEIGNSDNFSDEEFSKYALWSAIRGQSLCVLNESEISTLSQYKRASLSRALGFWKENFSILKNVSFIGGNPIDNNIYGYVSWNDDDGIIALRNPTKEETALTLTLNKLMGAPESLKDVRRENVLCVSVPETTDTFSYGDKIDLTLHPFEIMIFKFTK